MTYHHYVLKLLYPPGYYRFDVHPPYSLKITGNGFFNFLRWGKSITIFENPRQQILPFNQSVRLWPWNVTKIRRILLNKKHTAILAIMDNKYSIIDVMALHWVESADVGQSTPVRYDNKVESLYPIDALHS